MKKLLLLFTISLTIKNSVIAQPKTDEIYYFIKVWGMLKYYHPAIQKGKIDWDQVFLSEITPLIRGTNSGQPLEKLILVAGTSQVEMRSSGLYERYKNTPYANLNFDWVEEKQAGLSDQGRKWLMQVIYNYKPSSNKYIDREINKYYFNTPSGKFWFPSAFVPDAAQSLLSLARFWNIINYFNPHKNLFNKNWDLVLKEFIPQVIKNASTKNIYLTYAALARSIDDSHAFYNNYEFDSMMGLKQPGLTTSLYENRYNVITGVTSEMQKATGISEGDIITRVNKKTAADIRMELYPYCRASTERGTQRNIDFLWLNGNPGKNYEIEYMTPDRKTHTAKFTIRDNLFFKQGASMQTVSYREFSELNAVYLRMPATKDEMKTAFKVADNASKTLILDIRSGFVNINWNFILGKFLCRSTHFANYYQCSFNYPGYFAPEEKHKMSLFSSGKKFSGKLIVLADERVQSSLEYKLMILKSAVPEMTIIGRNTSGADGAATSILMQDNVLTYFTRDVVLFPDGKQTQRKGIVPDIYVEDSIELFRHGKDAILEKALEYIERKKAANRGTDPSSLHRL